MVSLLLPYLGACKPTLCILGVACQSPQKQAMASSLGSSITKSSLVFVLQALVQIAGLGLRLALYACKQCRNT